VEIGSKVLTSIEGRKNLVSSAPTVLAGIGSRCLLTLRHHLSSIEAIVKGMWLVLGR
jgi:hypothetical protein